MVETLMKKLIVAIDAIRGPAACVSTHSIRVLVHFQVCVHLTNKNSSSSTPDQDREEGAFGENITSRFCDSSAFSYCNSPFKEKKHLKNYQLKPKVTLRETEHHQTSFFLWGPTGMQDVPSWELAYPLWRQFWRWCSFSHVFFSSLEGTWMSQDVSKWLVGSNPNIPHLKVGYNPLSNHFQASWDIVAIFSGRWFNHY